MAKAAVWRTARRCDGDSSVMDDKAGPRLETGVLEEFNDYIENKGGYRIFTALHREHEKIWRSD